jgi:uncharacterized protein
MKYNFEWDRQKEISNFRKHKIAFEIAASIFLDPHALTIFDNEHSGSEDRWVSIGIAGNKNILVVVHTFEIIDEASAVIRIISARKATTNEIKNYQGN